MLKGGAKAWLSRFALLELLIFILVAFWLGFFVALLLIIVSSSYGSYRLKSRGMPYDMQRGRAWVAQSKVKPASILCDFLWLIPGFLSSILALILLVPLFRKMLMALLLAWLAKQGFSFAAKPQEPPASKKGKIHDHGKGQTVEGEFKRRDD